MANAKAKLYYTKEQYLKTLPVESGNIIFVPDSNKVCLDLGRSRFEYQTIAVLPKEEDRLAIEEPHEGFYFVESTTTVGRWSDSQWNRISSESADFVVYGETTESFPELGSANKLYFTDDGIYNWKAQSNKYNLIANANTWDSIENNG